MGCVIQPSQKQIAISSFDKKSMRFYGSIFSQTNGYMGIRGNFEETYSGDHLQGTYLAGVWYPDKTRVGWWKNGYPEYFGKAINAANIIGIRVFINEFEIDLAKSDILSFAYEFDLQTAVLTRSAVIRTCSGKIRIETSRFLSCTQSEICALRYSVQLLDTDAKVGINPYIDFNVRNEDANYDENFWQTRPGECFNKGGYIEARTAGNQFRKPQFDAGIAMQVNAKQGVPAVQTAAKQGYAEIKYNFDLKKGQTAQIEKIVAVVTSRDTDDVRDLALAYADRAAQTGFEALLEAHCSVMSKMLDDCGVEIEGDVAADQGMRYNLLQLLCTFRGQDSRLNVGPKGFTGEKYGGAAYWDTEGFLIPFYLGALDASVAKKLLKFRYNTLEEARSNAKKLGLAGALYPMVTFDGNECHNEWEITFEEIHRNGAIAYAIFYYVTYTDDMQFMFDYGFEIVLEISRFWADRVHYCGEKQAYMIHGVTGPNEYENNVNNNWYTNRIAKWTLEYTVWLMDTYGNRLKAQYAEAEKQRFREIAENIYLPYDKKRGVFVQHDTFLDKALVPVASIETGQRPICRHWSWDRILRSCYIKQADVLQGMFFLEDRFGRDVIQRNFAFYEPMTVHESSLSASVHSVMATRAGWPEKAYELFLQAVRLDIDDLNSDTSDGLHVTAMSGGWLALVKGFGGLQTAKGTLALSPYLPAKLTKYAFVLHYRDRVIHIEAGRSGVTLTKRWGEALAVTLYGKDCRLEDCIFAPYPAQTAGRRIRGFIFDLDGVLTDTARLHFEAWRKLAREQWEFEFTEEHNERFKGVERRTCMRILAQIMGADMSEEQIALYSDRKNLYYRQMIEGVTYKDLMPNVKSMLLACREMGIYTAVASASRNTRMLLERTGIFDFFNTIVDGDAVCNVKPDPECFIMAAKDMGLVPKECMVFEDAQSAIDAAADAGFTCVGVGPQTLQNTAFHLGNIGDLQVQTIL